MSEQEKCVFFYTFSLDVTQDRRGWEVKEHWKRHKEIQR